MAELAELAGQLELSGHLIAAVLVLARIAPLVALTPFLGGPTLSAVVRTGVALALVVAIYPAAYTGPLEPVGSGMLLVLMLKEAVVGVSLGLLAAVAFHTLSMAGQLVDQARGATMSQLQGPATGEEQSPLSSLYLQLGVVLFLLIGGHRTFLAAVAASYDVIPLGALPFLEPTGIQGVALMLARLVGGAIAAALMLAAPAVAAIMLTDLALGLLGRTAPQLGTYFMAMPLRAAVGLAMTLLSLSLVFREIAPYLAGLATLVRRTIEMLGQTSG